MLEILITGSSRPQLWPIFWESFKKMCIIRQDYRVTVHEDFVFDSDSHKVMDYCRKLQDKGEIHTLDFDNPARGLGWTLDHYMRKRFWNNGSSGPKYLFYLQEDWFFERPIDIDQIIWTMDQHEAKLNLIFFNKIKNNGRINKCEQREYEYSKMRLCLYHGWTFLPGIWRIPFVCKNWVTAHVRPEGAFTNQFGGHVTRMSVDYCEKNIGAYIYGPIGDPRQVRHLGNDWRMASWRLEDGRPGGRHHVDMDKPYMAPWVPYPEFPTQFGSREK